MRLHLLGRGSSRLLRPACDGPGAATGGACGCQGAATDYCLSGRSFELRAAQWLTPAHPDPKGEMLRRLARVLEAFLASGSFTKLGVFIE
jgi:hypothetical protein